MDKKNALKQIKDWAKKNDGIGPTWSELKGNSDLPSINTLNREFGNREKALVAAGVKLPHSATKGVEFCEETYIRLYQNKTYEQIGAYFGTSKGWADRKKREIEKRRGIKLKKSSAFWKTDAIRRTNIAREAQGIKKVTKKDIQKINAMRRDGYPLEYIADKLGFDKTTIQRHIKGRFKRGMVFKDYRLNQDELFFALVLEALELEWGRPYPIEYSYEKKKSTFEADFWVIHKKQTPHVIEIKAKYTKKFDPRRHKRKIQAAERLVSEGEIFFTEVPSICDEMQRPTTDERIDFALGWIKRALKIRTSKERVKKKVLTLHKGLPKPNSVKQIVSRQWSIDKIRYLQKHYPDSTAKKMASDLSMSVRAIGMKASRLGLKKSRVGKFCKEVESAESQEFQSYKRHVERLPLIKKRTKGVISSQKFLEMTGLHRTTLQKWQRRGDKTLVLPVGVYERYKDHFTLLYSTKNARALVKKYDINLEAKREGKTLNQLSDILEINYYTLRRYEQKFIAHNLFVGNFWASSPESATPYYRKPTRRQLLSILNVDKLSLKDNEFSIPEVAEYLDVSESLIKKNISLGSLKEDGYYFSHKGTGRRRFFKKSTLDRNRKKIRRYIDRS